MMVKSQVSLIALISTMMALALPAWSMNDIPVSEGNPQTKRKTPPSPLNPGVSKKQRKEGKIKIKIEPTDQEEEEEAKGEHPTLNARKRKQRAVKTQRVTKVKQEGEDKGEHPPIKVQKKKRRTSNRHEVPEEVKQEGESKETTGMNILPIELQHHILSYVVADSNKKILQDYDNVSRVQKSWNGLVKNPTLFRDALLSREPLYRFEERNHSALQQKDILKHLSFPRLGERLRELSETQMSHIFTYYLACNYLPSLKNKLNKNWDPFMIESSFKFNHTKNNDGTYVDKVMNAAYEAKTFYSKAYQADNKNEDALKAFLTISYAFFNTEALNVDDPIEAQMAELENIRQTFSQFPTIGEMEQEFTEKEDSYAFDPVLLRLIALLDPNPQVSWRTCIGLLKLSEMKGDVQAEWILANSSPDARRLNRLDFSRGIRNPECVIVSDFSPTQSVEMLDKIANSKGHPYRKKAAYRAARLSPGSKKKLKCLNFAARLGHEKAQKKLRWMYETGDGNYQLANGYLDHETPDVSKGMGWLHLAAKKGNEKAQHDLAKHYISGKYIDKNVTEGRIWLAKATCQGHKYSEIMLRRQAESTKNNKKGDAEAQFYLGFAFTRDPISPLQTKADQNRHANRVKKGLEWLTRAAEQEHPQAIYEVAMIRQDLSSLHHSAINGFRKAQVTLSKWYLEGNRVEKDVNAAAAWFLQTQIADTPEERELAQRIVTALQPLCVGLKFRVICGGNRSKITNCRIIVHKKGRRTKRDAANI